MDLNDPQRRIINGQVVVVPLKQPTLHAWTVRHFCEWDGTELVPGDDRDHEATLICPTCGETRLDPGE
jgi:hypothetical protein